MWRLPYKLCGGRQILSGGRQEIMSRPPDNIFPTWHQRASVLTIVQSAHIKNIVVINPCSSRLSYLPNNMRTVTASDITHAVLAAESWNFSLSSM